MIIIFIPCLFVVLHFSVCLDFLVVFVAWVLDLVNLSGFCFVFLFGFWEGRGEGKVNEGKMPNFNHLCLPDSFLVSHFLIT